MKGATISGATTLTDMPFQSAPPVKGATQDPCRSSSFENVSIRAPREGGDLIDDPLFHFR